MTDKQKLEAIKAYIIDCAKEAEGEIYYEYCKIAGFIESLPDEPVSEDLEQAAEEYYDRILSENRGKYNPDWNTYADGYEQSICAHVYPAFIDGANWQKEQMLKNAIEEVVFDGSMAQQVGDELPVIEYAVTPDDNLKIGDKVKLKIIKEE